MTPGGNHAALEAAATALLWRLKERILADSGLAATPEDLADDAVRAYQLSAAMQGFLTGKPATAPRPAGKAEGEGELGFTD